MNVLVIGAGHYVTGFREGDFTPTDKDFGVVLPSLFYLQEQKVIKEIFVAAGDGSKGPNIRKHVASWAKKLFGAEKDFKFYPAQGEKNYEVYKDILKQEKIDLAFVCAPDNTHVPIITELTKNKIPSFVVKPAVNSLNDFYKLGAIIKTEKVPVYVDYHKVYDEANLKILETIKSGKIGNIQYISTQQTQKKLMIDMYKRWGAALPKTFINYYLGSHYIHMTRFLTGATPKSVRVTGQFGIAREKIAREICDLTQTHITWSLNGSEFASTHLAGWNDSLNSPSMTFQEVEVIGSLGRVRSDQRYRGYFEISDLSGYREPNPYFFDLIPGLAGEFAPSSSYGFKSIKEFVQIAKSFKDGKFDFDLFNRQYPSFHESEVVTAILEAGEMSFEQGSKVIDISLEKSQFRLEG